MNPIRTASTAGQDPGPRPEPGERVFVGLSGGVDSAVSLLLLKRQGLAVSALFMKNWEEDDTPGYCAAAADLADASAVCERLDVPLHTVNFATEYWDRVFSRFLADYRNGLTPNPDVLCNELIKFDVFKAHAADLGADWIATGHYARTGPGPSLRLAADADKDQTYFLHRLARSQLARTLFPIGELSKRDVRRLAAQASLAPHDKPDSTGLCFVGERPFAEFLARFIECEPGPIVSLGGETLGQHRGLPLYTTGQRQGLGLGGQRGGSGAPWYVVAKEPAANLLRVAQGREHPALWRGALLAGAVSWVDGRGPALPCRALARIRHRQALQAVRLEAAGDGCIRVRFDAPQWAIAAGQSVAVYRGDECLGGGLIERAID